MIFLWFLSRVIWLEHQQTPLCDKLFFLNKSLNGFSCSYSTKLPDVFFIFHSVGTVLGKADYGEFFVALHGCTVGSHAGAYPKIGRGVALAAHASLIGGSVLGDRVSIGSNTAIFQQRIASDQVVFNAPGLPLQIRPSMRPYAQEFLNVDLSALAPLPGGSSRPQLRS